MTRTRIHTRKRVKATVKLNPFTVKKMINEIIRDVYGTTSYGQLKYHFDDKAMKSTLESAESFIENMWEHLLHLSNNDVVTIHHIQSWKRETNFKLRFKKNNLSLCDIFNT